MDARRIMSVTLSDEPPWNPSRTVYADNGVAIVRDGHCVRITFPPTSVQGKRGIRSLLVRDWAYITEEPIE